MVSSWGKFTTTLYINDWSHLFRIANCSYRRSFLFVWRCSGPVFLHPVCIMLLNVVLIQSTSRRPAFYVWLTISRVFVNILDSHWLASSTTTESCMHCPHSCSSFRRFDDSPAYRYIYVEYKLAFPTTIRSFVRSCMSMYETYMCDTGSTFFITTVVTDVNSQAPHLFLLPFILLYKSFSLYYPWIWSCWIVVFESDLNSVRHPLFKTDCYSMVNKTFILISYTMSVALYSSFLVASSSASTDFTFRIHLAMSP